jgi:CRP-like cAMP-binding protein
MRDPFLLKLRHGVSLCGEDEDLLRGLTRSSRSVAARCDIIADGSPQPFLPLILKGWACRYTDLQNGKRQITTIFLPGDLCEPFGVVPRAMDHAFGALTDVRYSPVSFVDINKVARSSARIEEALWWDLLMSSSVEREHIVSLGRRSAAERIGHLFCELQLRLEMIGLGDASGYDFPLTQADLSDILGLTSVHVNRSLQQLRKSEMISLGRRRLAINDLAGLREFSYFDPSYLHLSGSGARPPVDLSQLVHKGSGRDSV